MLEWIKNWLRRSTRDYTALAILILVVVAGYILQARTTIDHGEYCSHAHFGGHDNKSSTTEFPFIRHTHGGNFVISCEDDPTVSWEMPEGRGYQRFDGRRFEPSDRWPEESGVYVFAMRKRILYVGHTTNMKETLRVPSNHEKWSCLNENGPPTHIYARQHIEPRTYTYTGLVRRQDANRNDVTLLIGTFTSPCNN